MTTELKTFKGRVRNILEKHESARNNDGNLWAHYINTYCRHLTVIADGKPSVPLENFKYLPPSQSIRLARQLVQNIDGEFLPTDPKVRKARRIKEQNIRDSEWREAKEA